MSFKLMKRFPNIIRHILKPSLKYSNKYYIAKKITIPITLFTLAKCQSEVPAPGFYVNEESLEHEFLIKQACTVNVNAASQLLTVTVVAIQDTSQQLRESLSQEISLIRQALEWGDVTPEEHWERLIGVRGRLTDLNYNLRMLNSYMEYAEKLATVVAEISFLSGNLAASDTLCHRINQATSACKTQMDENHLLQTESLELQQIAISTSTQMEEILKSDVNSKSSLLTFSDKNS